MTTISIPALPGGSADLKGYLATPPGAPRSWPGGVMVHEIFGITDEMKRHAQRLAGAGYLTLVVDLFSDGGARKCLVATMRSMMSGEGRAFNDIEAARLALSENPQCTGKIGIIGFCMGGGFALLGANNGYAAASANYGPLPKDLDGALEGACPIVGSYGGKDRSLKGAAGKLEAALAKSGVAHDIKEYPSAGHGFLNDTMTGPKLLQPLLRVSGMRPDPSSSPDAWERIENFFAAHLTDLPAQPLSAFGSHNFG